MVGDGETDGEEEAEVGEAGTGLVCTAVPDILATVTVVSPEELLEVD